MKRQIFLDNFIVFIHLAYVVLAFVFIYVTPYYIGVLLMVGQIIHELIVGDCILTVFQRKYGYAEKEEDFFHYLFRKFKIDISYKVSRLIPHLIKLLIFILFLHKVYVYYYPEHLV